MVSGDIKSLLMNITHLEVLNPLWLLSGQFADFTDPIHDHLAKTFAERDGKSPPVEER